MSANDAAPAIENEDTPRGFAFALSAYLMWGFLPFYMKAVAHISPAEVIAHRILWSLPVAGAVLLYLRRTAELKVALKTPRMLKMAVITATLITINWGIYVWAIGAGRAIDAALGYYINPLLSVFLGAVLLKEKLNPAQLVAIGLAVLAVAVLTLEAGGLPWVALSLSLSWGFYAFFRKTLPVGPNQGFFLEVMILGLPALIYVLYLEITGQGHFFGGTSIDTALLVGSGVVTAVPLMVYANGAKLLRLSTIGIMQYIAPTMIFIIAVFAFKEPFGTAKMIAFPLIWAALLVYSWSMFRQSRSR
ncbi:EamA family transporter RarD [Rhizobiaceae bacterium n13]|uniref:EamA family transporter RarD n=1 Tax=Ferirhizobium litorale TaxID=2927786 RepID=A0AAE3Q8P9_9HYPH|nr:EamA family transporter RarD [Fererhizobium litorale]MDI7861110.1 EamA family transporter RarD [Fererhizobium litorale]MDI7921257.1 EamA family transporter RarD [Fererhizobium litorale]